MKEQKERLFTYEDYLKLPEEDGLRCEVIGNIFPSILPGIKH